MNVKRYVVAMGIATLAWMFNVVYVTALGWLVGFIFSYTPFGPMIQAAFSFFGIRIVSLASFGAALGFVSSIVHGTHTSFTFTEETS